MSKSRRNKWLSALRTIKPSKDKLFIPAEVPILPLRGTVAYPDLIVPLVVGRERSIRLIDEAMVEGQAYRDPHAEKPGHRRAGLEDLYTMGRSPPS